MVELSPLILDIGSGVSKSGENNFSEPSSVIPTVVGVPKYKQQLTTSDHYYGLEAMHSMGILNIKFPIEHGRITDWEIMGNIWNHIFKSGLHINPENRSVVLTVPMYQSIDDKFQKDKIAEYMFEKFNVGKLYLHQQPAAALIASGRTTGIVVESGDGLTQIAPIYEGYMLEASKVQKFAGRDITKYFQSEILSAINDNFKTQSSSMFEITRDIKEKMSTLAFDSLLKSDELHDKCKLPNYLQFQIKKDSSTHPYVLPDGTSVALGKQRYLAAEQMFDESSGNTPIYKLVTDSIALSDTDMRKALAQSIILAGGNTMFQNFAERLEKSVSIMAPHWNPKVFASYERKYMDWIGAATAASLSSFSEKWIAKDEWRENSNVVHTKCIS